MASPAGTRERTTSSSHHTEASPGTERVRLTKNRVAGRSRSRDQRGPIRETRDATASP